MLSCSTESPGAHQCILLFFAKVEYSGHSEEEVHGHLPILTRYDVFEEEGVIPGPLGEVSHAHTALFNNVR